MEVALSKFVRGEVGGKFETGVTRKILRTFSRAPSKLIQALCFAASCMQGGLLEAMELSTTASMTAGWQ